MINYYSYFLGSWTITDLDNGSVGSLSIQLTGSGAAHLVEYVLGDVKRTELWGYDPDTKHWSAAGFADTGERFTQTFTVKSETPTPVAGDKLIDEHIGHLPDGTPTSALLTLEIESANSYLVTATHGKEGEKSLPDMKMRCTRKT